MVEGKKKSRTFARRKYTTPGGKHKVRYAKRNKDAAICGMCGTKLSGVPRKTTRLAKTKKRPERPYGGVFCSACSRELITKKALEEAGGEE